MEASKLFVPGMWECPQCGFVQMNNVLSPAGVFASTAPELRPCPNDGRDMQPVTWEKHAKGLDEMLGKVLDEREWLLKQLNRFAPWRVFKINDCDWWMACTLEQACDGYRDEYGVDGIDVNPDDPPRVMTVEELDKLTFIDREKYDPMEPGQWECLCGCGERCTLADRWSGHAYEHSHGYPAGHCETRNIHKRTFAEELARRIAAGPRVELFATTEE